MKCRDGVVKALLRKSGEGKLPKEVLWRRKSPYPKTYHPDYEAMLGARLLEVLADPGAPIKQLVDKKKAEKFCGKSLRLWKTLVRTADGRSSDAGLYAPGQLLVGKISGPDPAVSCCLGRSMLKCRKRKPVFFMEKRPPINTGKGESYGNYSGRSQGSIL